MFEYFSDSMHIEYDNFLNKLKVLQEEYRDALHKKQYLTDVVCKKIEKRYINVFGKQNLIILKLEFEVSVAHGKCRYAEHCIDSGTKYRRNFICKQLNEEYRYLYEKILEYQLKLKNIKSESNNSEGEVKLPNGFQAYESSCSEYSMNYLIAETSRLTNEIADIYEDIRNIKNSFPYSAEQILKNEILTVEHKKCLDMRISALRSSLAFYTDKLHDIMEIFKIKP